MQPDVNSAPAAPRLHARRAVIGVAILVALAAAGYVLWPQPPRLVVDAPNAAAKVLADAKTKAAQPAAATKPAGHAHSHDLPPSLATDAPNALKLANHWWTGAKPNADGKFEAKATPLDRAPQCVNHPLLRAATLEDAVKRSAGFDPAQATPVDAQIQDMAQFWRLGNTHYKLTGRWERDQPATFRVTLFSAREPDFTGTLRVLPLPEGLSNPTDAMSLGDAMDREVAKVEAAGGQRGARLVQAFHASADGKTTHEVRTLNGQLVSWTFGDGRCQTLANGVASCRCQSEDDSHPQAAGQSGHQHPHKEEHRVKD
ncbi:MAG: hypothetical protein JNM76_06365 [Betaproteobacteria bacterium]|nr:hypothetical protein [Betaproteobacteria bacterium]